jgi:hypothetical protein
MAVPNAHLSSTDRANGRRELVAALMGCVLGAGVTLFAADRPWVHARVVAGSLQLPLSVRGGSLEPMTPAFGVTAAVAAVGSVHPGAGDLADRAGALVGTGSGTASEISHTAWGWLAVLGSVLFALAGAAAVLRGPSWPGMGARYEAPAAPAPRAAAAEDSALEQWRALDRGEDPTL